MNSASEEPCIYLIGHYQPNRLANLMNSCAKCLLSQYTLVSKLDEIQAADRLPIYKNGLYP